MGKDGPTLSRGPGQPDLVQGVPSRIGHLLDMAPRSREVLDFAASMVTWADDEARARDLDSLESEAANTTRSTRPMRPRRRSACESSRSCSSGALSPDGQDLTGLLRLLRPWADTVRDVNVAKLSEEEREKLVKDVRKSMTVRSTTLRRYMEDAAERIGQAVGILFKSTQPKDVAQ